jgi:hypothetical protein
MPAQRGQLICLSCGARMALDRGGSDKRAVAIAGGAIALVALLSLALVIDGLSGGDDRPAATAAAPERAKPAQRERPGGFVATQNLRRKSAAKARLQLAASAGTWPAGQDGWTVVLANATDEASAQSLAQNVEQAGIDAGVLSAEEHPSLGSDLWIVFSGVYADQLEASEAAAEIQATYPGAYQQFVE